MVLLLKEGNRFSIDIDIICKTDRKVLEEILNKVIKTSHFTDWKLDEHRSYQPGVPKAHYKLFFDTNQQGSGEGQTVYFDERTTPSHVSLYIRAVSWAASPVQPTWHGAWVGGQLKRYIA
jgi:hypothetical protein